MKSRRRSVVAATAAAAAVCASAAAWSQDGEEMMKKWKEIARPGAGHKLLDAMIGEWETTTRVTGMPDTKGSATFEWILGGRFVEARASGTFMGSPIESRSLYGFDNYKKHYLLTHMDSMSTHMLHADGKAERDQSAIHFYGRMDEWMDGTLKHNRYTLRFDGKDRMVLQIHDLDIGEKDNQVMEFEYRRKPR